jgi:hypothetical protein
VRSTSRGARRSSYGKRRARDDRYDDYEERRPYGYGRRGQGKNSKLLLFGGIGAAVVVIIIIAVVASGGGGASASTPADACLSYFRAIRARDFNTAYTLLSSNSRAAFEQQRTNMPPEVKGELCAELGITPEELDRMQGRQLFVTVMQAGSGTLEAVGVFDLIDQFEVGDTRVSGNTATVMIYMKGSDEGAPIRLVREAGGWKVDYRPSGL